MLFSAKFKKIAAMQKRSFWRDNVLSPVTFGLVFVFLIGQTVAGWKDQNVENLLHNEKSETFLEYTFSGDNAESIFENWESEFLQMGAYVLLTGFLFQRGSAESNDPDAPAEDEDTPHDDSPTPVRKGGFVKALYAHSLSLAFGILFLMSFVGHAISGAKSYSEELRQFG